MTTGAREQIERPTLDGMQKVTRVVVTAILWAANLVGFMYWGYIAAWLGGAPWENHMSYTTGESATWDYGVLPGLTNTLGLVLYVVLWGWLASLVDYRWRDGLLVVIPIVGIVLTAKWLYRLVALQVRDWRPAPEVYRVGRVEAGLRLLASRLRRLTAW